LFSFHVFKNNSNKKEITGVSQVDLSVRDGRGREFVGY